MRDLGCMVSCVDLCWCVDIVSHNDCRFVEMLASFSFRSKSRGDGKITLTEFEEFFEELSEKDTHDAETSPLACQALIALEYDASSSSEGQKHSGRDERGGENESADATPGFWNRVNKLFHAIDDSGNGDDRISRDELAKHFQVCCSHYSLSIWIWYHKETAARRGTRWKPTIYWRRWMELGQLMRKKVPMASSTLKNGISCDIQCLDANASVVSFSQYGTGMVILSTLLVKTQVLPRQVPRQPRRSRHWSMQKLTRLTHLSKRPG